MFNFAGEKLYKQPTPKHQIHNRKRKTKQNTVLRHKSNKKSYWLPSIINQFSPASTSIGRASHQESTR